MVAGFSWDRCSKTPKLKLQGCSDLLSGVIQHLYHHVLLVKREPEPAWVPGQRTTKEHESWEERLFGVPSLEFSYCSLKVHKQTCLLQLFFISKGKVTVHRTFRLTFKFPTMLKSLHVLSHSLL